jgi:hypothetical protein
MSLREKLTKLLFKQFVRNTSHHEDADEILSLISEELIKELPMERLKFSRDIKTGRHWSYEIRVGYNKGRMDCKEVITKTLK